jgi:tRNA(Ile)-lysidine synthase
MKEVYDYLLNEIKLKDGNIIVVGVSFGPDSMALLHILMELRNKIDIKIVCAHINHNIRKASNKEKKLLEQYCLKNNIIFEAMVIEKYGDDNFHNEARKIRYEFFNDLVAKYEANYLMTAHHGDDLIETILMRIVRGSTLKGYSGFKRIVNMGKYQLVRPLITVTKKDIVMFNKQNKIPYATDLSNRTDHYTRNRYRKVILPFLKKEDPLVHEKFRKFSETLSFYSHYIDEEANKHLSAIWDGSKLDIKKFQKLDYIWQKNVINKLLEQFYQDDLIFINDKHTNLILKIIQSEKSNTYIYLPNNVKVSKAYTSLTINKETDIISNYEIQFIDCAYLPNGKIIDKIMATNENGNDICRLAKEDYVEPLYIRTRKHGDKIDGKGMNGHQKVKDIFIDKKIPIKERDLWPIVVDATDKVVWIPGIKKAKIDKSNKEKYDIILRYR